MRTCTKPGYTLIELSIALIVVGVLSAVGVVAFGQYRQKAQDTQVTTVLSSVVADQQSWFLTHNAFVGVPESGAGDSHNLSANGAQILLRRIAPGFGDDTEYINGSQAPSEYGQISVRAASSATGAVIAVSAVTVAGRCAGAVSGSGAKTVPARIFDPAPSSGCSADAILNATQ